MILISILAATLAGGVLSVLLAAGIGLTWLRPLAERLLAYAVGLLLGFALVGLLPEALDLGLAPQTLGQGLIAGLLGFFLLEKAVLWRHDHPIVTGMKTASDAHPPQVWLIVVGDAMHNFVDGVLIAAAFLVDAALGWATAVAVLAHEVPQELGDFLVLLAAGLSRARALALNALSGLAMVAGGVIGYLALEGANAVLPYVLVLAAASFLYIAVADLMPALNRHRSLRAGAQQFALLLAGVVSVHLLQGALAHGH